MAKENNKKRRDPGIYSLALVEKKSHKVLWQRDFTRNLLWLSISAVVLIGAAIVYCIIAFTPLRVTIPGYPDARSRNAAVHNAIKIDSLENLITRWDLYAENLSRVIDAREPLNIDSVIRRRNYIAEQGPDPALIEESDSLLRKEVLGAGQFSVSGQSKILPLEGRHFFTPLKGAVSRHFDAQLHPWADISAPAGSMVMSVLDGTVVFTGWNDESGYTIAVQHESGVLTFYKHNQKILKQFGDRVTAGTPIALLGSSLESSDHLRFELWYNGSPVDPEMYISF